MNFIWTSYEHNVHVDNKYFCDFFFLFSKQKTIKFIMRFHFFWFHYYTFNWTLLIIILLITKSQLICVHHNWFSWSINLLSTLNSFPELFFPYCLLCLFIITTEWLRLWSFSSLSKIWFFFACQSSFSIPNKSLSSLNSD